MTEMLKKIRNIKHVEWIILLIALGAMLSIYAAQRPSSTQTQADELELRLSSVLSMIEGAGKVESMIIRDAQGQPSGAILVASGANDVSTAIKITRAASKALNIPISAVELFAMVKEGEK